MTHQDFLKEISEIEKILNISREKEIAKSQEKMAAANILLAMVDELEKYRAIGTIEECMRARMLCSNQREATDTKYYKFLNEDLRHYGMQYKEGLNVNCEETIPEDAEAHGLFFADAKNIFLNCFSESLIAEVEIPEGEPVYAYKYGVYKAHRIILKNIRRIMTPKTLEELEQEGVNLHADDDFILTKAIHEDKLDILIYLQNHGFDIYKKRKSLINVATAFGTPDIIEYLSKITQ